MQNLRAVRRHRALTLLDLASLTGISARQLAEIEHGLRRLSAAEREALAFVFGLSPQELTGAHRRSTATSVAIPYGEATSTGWPSQTLLIAMLAAAVATGSLSAVLEKLPQFSAPHWSLQATAPHFSYGGVSPTLAEASGSLDAVVFEASRDDANLVWQQTFTSQAKRSTLPHEPLEPRLVLSPTPGDEVAPAPLPVIAVAPAFTLTEQGPLGCPVKPAQGRVVLTQGYGVGTHAPAEVWGAVDLAVDADDDGYPDDSASWYTPIVATHDGIASVTLDSDPAGNHIWLNEPGGIWRTGYSHLALVMVVSGQFVRAGEQIGLMGSTGTSTGPHLDYQVWQNGVNIDPTGLVGCS